MTAEAYPLSWPVGWPRTLVHQRRRAEFASHRSMKVEVRDPVSGVVREKTQTTQTALTIYAAMRRLQDQLDKLGASAVLLSTNVELRLDGQPRSNRPPPADPGAAVYFKLKGHDRVLACDKWDRVPDNIAAIAGHIDAIRRQDRYGVGTLEQAFVGYAALPSPEMVGKRPWRSVLMVGDGPIGLETVEQVYRSFAKEAHADVGGNNERMVELNVAIDDARRELGAAAA